MSGEDLIPSLTRLQLEEPVSASVHLNRLSHNITMSEPKADNCPARQWLKWSGDPSDFAVFLISLEGIADEFKNSKSFCYHVFSNSLPSEAQKRVAPWIEERKFTQKWDIDQFLLHLEDLFVDNDAPNRAQAKIHAIRQ